MNPEQFLILVPYLILILLANVTFQNKITFIREWFMMKALAQLVSIYIFYKLYQHAKISQQFFIPYAFLSSHIGEFFPIQQN